MYLKLELHMRKQYSTLFTCVLCNYDTSHRMMLGSEVPCLPEFVQCLVIMYGVLRTHVIFCIKCLGIEQIIFGQKVN